MMTSMLRIAIFIQDVTLHFEWILMKVLFQEVLNDDYNILYKEDKMYLETYHYKLEKSSAMNIL